MKKAITLLFISITLLLNACFHSNNKEEIIESTKSTEPPKDEFIEIPFSTIKRLASMDSIGFAQELTKLGYATKSHSLFASPSSIALHGDSLEIIGIGKFFLYSIPVVLKTDWHSSSEYFRKNLYHSFPIEYLSSYKYSMLHDKTDFFKILNQEAKYDDKLKVNYVEETYVDLIDKIEYKYLIGPKYVMLILSGRSYL